MNNKSENISSNIDKMGGSDKKRLKYFGKYGKIEEEKKEKPKIFSKKPARE